MWHGERRGVAWGEGVWHGERRGAAWEEGVWHGERRYVVSAEMGVALASAPHLVLGHQVQLRHVDEVVLSLNYQSLQHAMIPLHLLQVPIKDSIDNQVDHKERPFTLNVLKHLKFVVLVVQTMRVLGRRAGVGRREEGRVGKRGEWGGGSGEGRGRSGSGEEGRHCNDMVNIQKGHHLPSHPSLPLLLSGSHLSRTSYSHIHPAQTHNRYDNSMYQRRCTHMCT